MPDIKNIKKETEAVDKQEKQLALLREHLKARCSHTKNGEPDIVPSANKEPGQLNYICRRCRKELSLKKLTDEEIKNAVGVIDRAIDTIKLTLNLEREDEQKILKKVAKTQYRLRNEVLALYGASLKRNRNGGGKQRPQNNNNTSGWGKPQIDR